MAVNIARGVCALGYAFYGANYVKWNFWNPFMDLSKKINDPDLSGHATQIAAKRGIKKPVILIEGDHIRSCGNNVFPGSVVVQVGKQCAKANQGNTYERQIDSELTHMAAHDELFWSAIPLVLGIATTLFFNAKAPLAASLGGLAIGAVSVPIIWRWRCIVAHQVMKASNGS